MENIKTHARNIGYILHDPYIYTTHNSHQTTSEWKTIAIYPILILSRYLYFFSPFGISIVSGFSAEVDFVACEEDDANAGKIRFYYGRLPNYQLTFPLHPYDVETDEVGKVNRYYGRLGFAF